MTDQSEHSFMRQVASDHHRLAGGDKLRILAYIERAERMERALTALRYEHWMSEEDARLIDAALAPNGAEK